MEVNSKNKGWARNFADALHKAKGDIVFLADQDDIWRSDKIEKCSQIMNDNPQIDVLCTNYELISDNSALDTHKIEPYENDKKVEKIDFYREEFFRVYAPGCTYCCRKEFIERIYKYNIWDFPHDANLFRMARMDKGLYCYHDNLIKWRRHTSATTFSDADKIKNDPRREMLNWIKYALRVIGAVEDKDFLDDIKADRDTRKIVRNNKKWLNIRKNFYSRGNIIDALSLIMYRGCYSRYLDILEDWKSVYKNGRV